MSAEGKALNRSREAWAALADEFADIGRRFREDYDKVGETATTGTEKSQESIDRAVSAVCQAVAGTAHAIGDALRDPKIRQETEEAGSALLRAVGVTLSELGESLQRDAEREKNKAET
jgi:argininosuccinate lyase